MKYALRIKGGKEYIVTRTYKKGLVRWSNFGFRHPFLALKSTLSICIPELIKCGLVLGMAKPHARPVSLELHFRTRLDKAVLVRNPAAGFTPRYLMIRTRAPP